MTSDQKSLLDKARREFECAEYILKGGFYDQAASSAYYVMFYLAEAFLLSKGLEFSKHLATSGAFGREFSKTGKLPTKFHSYLIEGQRMRLVADYGNRARVEIDETLARRQVNRAQEFLRLAEEQLDNFKGE